MTNRKKQAFPARRRIAVLVAAVLVLTAMTVTAFASEEIAGWFRSYFGRNEHKLSEEQLAYLEENEQFIGKAQSIDGWTVELRSVIHD